jgi:hypothetical protein
MSPFFLLCSGTGTQDDVVADSVVATGTPWMKLQLLLKVVAARFAGLTLQERRQMTSMRPAGWRPDVNGPGDLCALVTRRGVLR